MTEEVRRYGVVAAALDGRMMNGEAAAALGVSLRQLKRIKAKVKKEGPSGIKHGNSGRPSCRAFPAGMKERAMKLANEKYFDFQLLPPLGDAGRAGRDKDQPRDLAAMASS